MSDKVVHFVLFGVLGGALAFGRRWSGGRTSHLAAVAVGMLYGASDEWHQAMVPNRVPSLEDWYADAAGVLAGYLLITLILRRAGRRAGA